MEEGYGKMDVDSASSALPHLNNDIISIILDFLIEPYLYHPGTGELYPMTGFIALVLRPCFLVSRSWAEYCRGLAVRHLCLDLDSWYQYPSSSQLITFVLRHCLGSEIRSLVIKTDREQRASHGYHDMSLGANITTLLAEARHIQHLYWMFERRDFMFSALFTLFNSREFDFYHSMKTLSTSRNGKQFHTSYALQLAELFPNLETLKGLVFGPLHTWDPILPARSPNVRTYTFNLKHLDLVTNGLAIAGTQSSPKDVSFLPALQLMQDSFDTLESLSLEISVEGSPPLPTLVPPYFPRLHTLRICYKLGTAIGGADDLVSACPHLEVVDVQTDNLLILDKLPLTIRHLGLKIILGEVTAAAAEIFARFKAGLSRLQLLESVHLELDMDGESHEEGITLILLAVREFCLENDIVLFTSDTGVHKYITTEYINAKFDDDDVLDDSHLNALLENVADLSKTFEPKDGEGLSDDSAEFSDEGEWFSGDEIA